MKSSPSSKPIQIPEDIAARCDGADHVETFDNLFRTVIVTPKAEIDKNEAKRKREQIKKRTTKHA